MTNRFPTLPAVLCTFDAFGLPTSPVKGVISGPARPLATAFLDMAGSRLRPDREIDAELFGVAALAACHEFEWNVSATRRPDGQIVATWEGVFTPGRVARLTVEPDGSATLAWDTGTDKPSRWIGCALEAAGVACFSRRAVAAARVHLTPKQHGRLAARASQP
jgi:hypothetical protein